MNPRPQTRRIALSTIGSQESCTKGCIAAARCNMNLMYHEITTNLILYYTILYYILLYSTLLYSTLLYSTLLYSTLLYSTILYYTILYYTILYYTILYYTILYYTIVYDSTATFSIQDHRMTKTHSAVEPLAQPSPGSARRTELAASLAAPPGQQLLGLHREPNMA